MLALVLATGPAATALTAQQTYRVRRAENFRRDPAPQASLLARVNPGVAMQGDSVRGQWVQVTLEGWVWAASVTSTTREGHDLIVSARNGENLRVRPNGDIIARLSQGCLLDEVERRSAWVRVQRKAWMFRSSLERVDATATPGRPGEVPTAMSATDTGMAALDRAVAADRAVLHRTPEGPPTATLAPDAPVRVLARSGEWVRVQTEGWVRESELKPASPGVLVGVSGAEVRSRPQEFEGKLLQWVVQYIAIQRADELRREIPAGQRYLLARGPLPEAGFVYIMLSEEQLAAVERLPPLAELVVIGRVHTARSQYLGNPILVLMDWAVREQ
ncbi:MAG: hypothetical protein GTN78_19980 [Gemmatimonadales bacterium]|nr:hypothetical protein [Gemmatimonadales bacterium]NIN12654.1 hypothetical protein [Gemmatimonadales bacterium]NIR02447.1 hypothetical protein [Gemmatimonadales bacterium]NIS66238.1 hypothetical protein [Gemmatimonadales bacterium]